MLVRASPLLSTNERGRWRRGIKRREKTRAINTPGIPVFPIIYPLLRRDASILGRLNFDPTEFYDDRTTSRGVTRSYRTWLDRSMLDPVSRVASAMTNRPWWVVTLRQGTINTRFNRGATPRISSWAVLGQAWNYPPPFSRSSRRLFIK